MRNPLCRHGRTTADSPAPPPRRVGLGTASSFVAQTKRRRKRAFLFPSFDSPCSSESSMQSDYVDPLTPLQSPKGKLPRSQRQRERYSQSARKEFWKNLFERDISFSLRSRRTQKVKRQRSQTLRRSKSIHDFIRKPFSHNAADLENDPLRRSKSFQDFMRSPFGQSPRRSATIPMTIRKKSSVPGFKVYSRAKRMSQAGPRTLVKHIEDIEPTSIAEPVRLLDSATYDRDAPEIKSVRAVHTPSSVFGSEDVPICWGNVLRASSTYSRPASAQAPGAAARLSIDQNTRPSGAWARFPSHTREARTGPAGPKHNIIPRDFAHEPRLSSQPLNIGQSITEVLPPPRKKKRNALKRSQSVQFVRTFIREYTMIFTRQSSEFIRHGHGHRSSISAGGILAEPELEMLPPAFPAFPLPREMSLSVSTRSDPGRRMSTRLKSSSNYSETVKQQHLHGGDMSADFPVPKAPISASELYAQWYFADCVKDYVG